MYGTSSPGAPHTQIGTILRCGWHGISWIPTSTDNETTDLDALHIELDTETLNFLPKHVIGIRRLSLGTTDELL